jgi:DNA-directed RNA polymerase subunit omega
MLYPSIDKIRDKVANRYALVILTAKRARDIVNGYPILLDDYDEDEKPVSEAAYEIESGIITYSEGSK